MGLQNCRECGKTTNLDKSIFRLCISILIYLDENVGKP